MVRICAKSVLWLSVITGIVFTLGGCKPASKPGANSRSGDIPVGVYLSFTGSTATFGESTFKGILLATEEVNARGGINGRKIVLHQEDDRSDAQEARSAVTKLIQRDGVVAVLGEVASSRSLAAAPICQENKIPMISPSSTNPQVTQVGDYIFRVCFIDPFQGAVMAKFAAETLKVKRVAVLTDVKNDYSVGLAKYFKETFTKLGGQIVAEKSYSEGDPDFRAQLTAIKAANPEAIFVPGYYSEVGTIARQARELGIRVPFLGGDGWDSPKLVEGAGNALEGSYFSNHYSHESTDPAVQGFVAKFKQRFNGEVPDALAALGYDAANILFDAIRRAGSPEPTKIRDALAQTKDFPGVTGKITIDADRNAVKPAVILQIRGKEFKYVQTIQP
ncbi:MAG: ethanolamine utilization protein EutJ [Armatimonadota bacterium]|nr:MAG: ethanolamine utilization protein EutJ [Armatimonadota bacterium]